MHISIYSISIILFLIGCAASFYVGKHFHIQVSNKGKKEGVLMLLCLLTPSVFGYVIDNIGFPFLDGLALYLTFVACLVVGVLK